MRLIRRDNMQHKILIVDDEKPVRDSMVLALSKAYKTFQAANGREALEIMNMNSDISVVVSDLQMPEVNGLELLDKIRTENKNVPVIFVTASAPVESKSYAAQIGAFEYMTKPLDLKQLETVIQSAIESQRTSHGKSINKGELS